MSGADLFTALQLDKALENSIIEDPSMAEECFKTIKRNNLENKTFEVWHDRDKFVEDTFAILCTPRGRSFAQYEYEYAPKELDRARKNPKTSARTVEYIEADLDAMHLLFKYGLSISDPERRLEYFKAARYAYRNKENCSEEEINNLKIELERITSEDNLKRLRKLEIQELLKTLSARQEYQKSLERIGELKKQVREIPNIEDLEQIDNAMKALNKKHNELGLFSRKEKKELEAQYSVLEKRRKEMSPPIEKKKNEIDAKISEENKKIVSYRNYLDEIDAIGFAFTNKTARKMW